MKLQIKVSFIIISRLAQFCSVPKQNIFSAVVVFPQLID